MPSGYKLASSPAETNSKSTSIGYSPSLVQDAVITFNVEALFSDLVTNKTSDTAGATKKVGETIEYTITVTQNGNEAATGCVLTDRVPANTTFVSATPAVSSNVGGLLTWNLSDIAASGGQAQVKFTVSVNDYPDTTTGSWTINNQDAHFSSTTPAIDVDINAVTDSAARPILQIEKFAGYLETDILDVGDQMDYGITILNVGGIAADSVTVTDVIPDHVTVVSIDNGGYTISGGTAIQWDVGTVGLSSTPTQVKFTIETTSAGQAVNTAKVNGVDTNTLTHTIVVKAPVLEIEKSSNIAFGTHVDINTVFNYTVTVKNTGNKIQPAYTITDTIPDNTTYVDGSASDSGTVSGGVITWNMPALAEGDTATVTFSVTGTTPGTVRNKAVVNGVDTNELIHFIDTPPTVLEISKASSIPESIKLSVDDTLVYTITVTNKGLLAVDNIPVSDTVPDLTSYVDNSADNGGAISGNMLYWTIPTLAVDESINLTFEVVANEKGTITNVAQVNGQNTNTVTNTVDRPVKDLTYSKRGTYPDMTLIKLGDVYTYYIDLENTGSKPILNTVVEDALPSFVKLVDGTISGNGTLTNGTITWVEDNLLPGEKVTYSFDVKVAGYGTIVNFASVDGFATNTITYVVDSARDQELAYSKSGTYPNNSSVKFGETLTYKISVDNITDLHILHIGITDAIPANTQLVEGSITHGGVVEKGVITWVIQDFAPQASTEVSFQVKVTGHGNIVNEATVAGALTNKLTYFIQSIDPPSPPVPDEVKPGKVPKTGDDFNYIWVIVLALAVIGVGVCMVFLLSKRKKRCEPSTDNKPNSRKES